MASLGPAPIPEMAAWRQHKIYGQRISKDGIEYDVEMRRNGKRKSEWITAGDTGPHLVRKYNAKCRIERSQQKEVQELVMGRSSQTIFIISDAEDDDDEDEASVISLNSSDGDIHLNHEDMLHDLPAVGCATPRRSSRQLHATPKYNEYISQRPGLSAYKTVISNDHAVQRVPHHPIRAHSIRSSPSPQEESLFQCPESLTDSCCSPVKMSSSRRETRHSSSKVPEPATPVTRSRLRQSKKTASGDEAVSERKSNRIRSVKASHVRDDRPLNGFVSPSIKSGPAKRKLMKSKPSPDSPHEMSPKQTSKKTAAGIHSDSVKKGRKAENTDDAMGVSTATCILHKLSSVSEPYVDELTGIGFPTDDQAAVTSAAEVSLVTATPSSRTSTPTARRPQPTPPTPMSEKIVRTLTTKSGRQSVSKIEDSSFLYDVNAIAKEDADIQKKTRVEEALQRKRKSHPEASLTQFYQSKAPRSAATPEVCVRKVSEIRRKFSDGERRLQQFPLWKGEDIDVTVMKQKAAGSVPVEIKGENLGNYFVEFSKGMTLGVPVHILEKHFPEEHKNLVSQRALSRVRPVTPAPSQPRSPASSIFSPSTPRAPVALDMDDSPPPSPTPKDTSFDQQRDVVHDRRLSCNSLMSDIDMPDDVEIFEKERSAHVVTCLESELVCYESGDSCQAFPKLDNCQHESIQPANGSNGDQEVLADGAKQTELITVDNVSLNLQNCDQMVCVQNEEESGIPAADQKSSHRLSETNERSAPQVEVDHALDWDAFVTHLAKEPSNELDEIHSHSCTAVLEDM